MDDKARRAAAEDLRRLRENLAAELAAWFSGPQDPWQEGRVAAVAGCVAATRYAFSGHQEVALAVSAAHLLNTGLRRACRCGTRGCTKGPMPRLGAVDEGVTYLVDGAADLRARRPGSRYGPGNLVVDGTAQR